MIVIGSNVIVIGNNVIVIGNNVIYFSITIKGKHKSWF